MASNPIEELIISLGLDASKLGDGADASNKAIQSIRENVTGLNGELQETEKLLKSMGTQFGGFGKAARAPKAAAVTPASAVTSPAAAVTPASTPQAKEQAKAEAKKTREANDLFDFKEKLTAYEKKSKNAIGGMNSEQAKRHLSFLETEQSSESEKKYRPEDTLGQAKGKERVDSLSRLIPYTKKQYEIAQREEIANKKQRKMPHSVGGLLMGAGAGALGPLAAGVYLIKNLAGAVKDFFAGIKASTDESQKIKQSAEELGISAHQLDYFRAASARFGDNTGKLADEFTDLARSFSSMEPGKFNFLLQQLNISALDSQKRMRPVVDVMAELADKMKELKAQDPAKYKYFRDIGGMSKQMTDTLSLGGDALKGGEAPGQKSEGMMNDQAAMNASMAQSWSELKTSMEEGLMPVVALTAGLMKLASWLMQAAVFLSPITQLNRAADKVFGGSEKKSVNVTPSAPISAHPEYGEGQRTGGEAPSIEHMAINVSIDKNGQATANVSGAKPRRVSSSLVPYAAAQ